MLKLSEYASLGAALRAALERWPRELCLIEADRERENHRLTYLQFKEAALPLAAALQERGLGAGNHAAIIMSNQSKWLISAYAIFHSGAVLVPLDYKLTAREQMELLTHSESQFLITEYHLWRSMQASAEFSSWTPPPVVLVTDAPAGAPTDGCMRWEEARSMLEPSFVPRSREDAACVVYSSGTAGRPKGCVLTHDNYLEQCSSLTSLFPFWPGVRYLSILPTNHAIDFMVGFIGPFVCGACVVHLRTLRPEFIREAFARYRITYVSVVPLVLKNLEKNMRSKFAGLPLRRRKILDLLVTINRALTRKRARVRLSRRLLPQVHTAFGGELLAIFVGGAFMEPSTLQFFYDLGIPVANGYGLTEAGTAVTLNDFRPFRADTVGKPLPGVALRILDPDEQGIGEVAVRSRTVMSHYLKDPELTAETIVEGWLMTGDLGVVDPAGHLHLFGRKKNMIVTEGGKNIYPEDIEKAFEDVAAKEYCVFAADYIWPKRELGGEQLVMVLRLEPGQTLSAELRREIERRNRTLPDFKRVQALLVWDQDFPRTASLKIRRNVLAGAIRESQDRSVLVPV
jgi:long-chain acyl-CoA synthetase